LVVDKANQELLIYRHDGRGGVRLEKIVPCSTGMVQGDKLVRGDKKTPEGYYIFRQKLLPDELPDIYGVLAYPMDYPNFWDVRLGRGGDGIWTHGVNKPLTDYDSNGCIELRNHDIAALEDQIKLYDTPVLVYENLVFRSSEELKKEGNELIAFVESWRKAWSDKDLESYEAKYAEEFYNSDGRTRSGWMENKRRLAANYRRIDVQLEDVRIYRHRDVVAVSFVQKYRGDDRFTTDGLKRLYAKKIDGRWLIVGEEFDRLPGPQPEKWLTAEQKRLALTTPPLTAAQVAEPVAVASAGVIMPQNPSLAAEVAVRPVRTNLADDDQAAADETARATIESLSAGARSAAPPPAGVESEPPAATSAAELASAGPAVDAETPAAESTSAGLAVEAKTPAAESASPAAASAETAPETVETAAAGASSSADVGETPAPEALAEDLGEEGARRLLAGWLAAWSNRDEESYFAYYAPGFRFADKDMGLKAFKSYRGRLMRQASSIQVSADEVDIEVDGLQAKVVFVQSYRSDRVSDRGRKTLALKAVDGAWRITSEIFADLP
jgi:murein L,D-transpeptidase YafK